MVTFQPIIICCLSKMLYTWINLMDEICPSLFKLMVKFVWVLNMS